MHDPVAGPSADKFQREREVARLAWQDAFAVLYVAREKCSPEEGQYVAELLNPMMGSMDVLDAVSFLLADADMTEAVRSRYTSTL